MELKDQILQTKERKQGFLKAMPQSTRQQINVYQKMEKLKKRFWIVLAGAAILSVVIYLVSCLAVNNENKWIVHAVLAGLWVVGGAFFAFYLRSLAEKSMKAISLGAQDYVDELNVINSRLAGLQKAEKERVEAEKQEAKAKARAEAAQREAQAALQRQQAVLEANNAAPQQPVEAPAPEPPSPPQE